MAMIKYIKRQDCGLKTTSGKSGDSGVNLPREIFDYINLSGLKKGSECKVKFLIYKDDYIKAADFISTFGLLYVTDSKSFEKVPSVPDLYSSLQKEVEEYFEENSSKEYSCTLTYKEDGRIYILGMKNGDFSVRDFLVEGLSAIQFEVKNDKIELHTMSNITDDGTTVSESKKHTDSRLILSDSNITRFAFKCISYFSEQPNWSNIENFINGVNSIKDGDLLKVCSKGAFSLTGMFRCTTEVELTRRYNTPRRRWYSEPFKIGGKTVFLSTEWYPGPHDDGTPYGLMIPDLGRFITACYGEEYIYRNNGGVMELWKEVEAEPGITAFSISSIISLIAETGLQYDQLLVKRFAFSLMTKPFVILSGLAGSGKTQLALAFAKAFIEDSSQMCTVSVGADWTNREPLLGYPNALDSTKYVRPESGVLDLLIEANKPANARKPYFLILDEMNMSYVERYFADFLSAMESHEAIKLWNGAEEDSVPASVKLPKNLFIIGTINVDETTYMFSPKVLDRANVIEFKIAGSEMEDFLGNIRSIDRNSICGRAAGMAESFLDKASGAEITPDDTTRDTLIRFFNQLKTVNAEFGYRSASEIYRYIDIARKNDDTPDDNTILDCAMVQKLLPKLHGSRKKLVPVLKALWGFCCSGINLDDAGSVPEDAEYPLTADKVLRMYRSALDNGFTSYSEA